MPNEIDSLLFADATAQAEEIRSALPPFLGVSVSFKDVVDVAGVVTTHSCKLLADDVAEADSPIVRRFRAAGLVVLGKTNTPEFCTTIGSHGRARTGLRQGGET